jgi:hypothetical protein
LKNPWESKGIGAIRGQTWKKIIHVGSNRGFIGVEAKRERERKREE